MRKNKAFTLAEVLITLGIIGVIAALTLPTLITGTNSAKTGPELANAVSTLENAIQQFMTDNNADYVSVAMRKAGDTGESAGSIDTLINNYLFSSTTPYIKGSTVDDPPTSSKQWSGSDGGYKSATTAVRMLANKSLICTEASEGGCKFTATDSACGIIFYTSGFQKKQSDNKLITGRDVFKLWVTNKGEIIPDGLPGVANSKLWTDDKNCGETGMKAGSASGLGCAGRIAANGWKVDY